MSLTRDHLHGPQRPATSKRTDRDNVDDLGDLELLTRDELIEMLVERAEAGVKLSFPGKANARRLARLVRPRVQKSIASLSSGDYEAQSRNLVIEGDNLQSMVTLYKERGQVDLIITDPPYNTGNDFRYNDKWDEDPNDPGIGELVSEDDAAKHTKWMRFMYPRLRIMKSMLKPSGVIAICIDYRELFHLGQMLDELFGERNRLAIINWQKSYTTRGDSEHVAATTEYVLVYANDAAKAKTGLLPRSDTAAARYKSPDGDPRPWKSGHSGGPSPEKHKSMIYGIQHPFTGEMIYPNERNCWRFGRAEMRRLLEEWGATYIDKSLDDGLAEPALVIKGSQSVAAKAARRRLKEGSWPRLFFGAGGTGRPQVKNYLDAIKKGVVAATYWADEEYDSPVVLNSTSWDHEESGHSQQGVKELTAVVGAGHGFDTVKPLKLISKMLTIWCPPDGLVLDAFAGSGTTGHAVLALNQELGIDRRFILIEQGRPEKGDSYARTLTATRLSRAVSGNWAEGKQQALGGGFRFVSLDKKVDAEALLAMEREEMVDAVIASYYDTSRRRGNGLIGVDVTSYQYLVARNSEGEGFFLIWNGPDKNTDFTEDVYEICSEEARHAELKPVYHVYARYNLFQTENVNFLQIPDRILIDFGLDLRTDSFSEAGEQ